MSALPLLDPLVPGRMESMPNRLAFVPQFGTSLPAAMVRLPAAQCGAYAAGCPGLIDTAVSVDVRSWRGTRSDIPYEHPGACMGQAPGCSSESPRGLVPSSPSPRAQRQARRGPQGLPGRVRNAAVYLGSLVVEQARVLPMYRRLCSSFNVDCFDRELLHSTAMFLCACPPAKIRAWHPSMHCYAV